MRSVSRPILLLPVALLAGCPPAGQDSGTTSEPGGSSSSSGSSDSTATDTTPTTTGSTEPADPSTSGSSSTGGDTGTTQAVDTTGLDTTNSDTTDVETSDTTADESSSTGETGDPPDTTGGELCGDVRDPVDIEWSLEVPPALAGEPLTADCTVADWPVMGVEASVTFNCPVRGVQHAVVLHYSLPAGEKLDWYKNDPVKLVFRGVKGPWTSEWLHITGGAIYFRGVHADALAPPDSTIEEFYGTNVGMNAACEPQPDACGQRQGLEVSFSFFAGGDPTYVAIQSGEATQYGFPVLTRIWLERATQLIEPIGCADVAPVWIDLIFVDDYSNF